METGLHAVEKTFRGEEGKKNGIVYVGQRACVEHLFLEKLNCATKTFDSVFDSALRFFSKSASARKVCAQERKEEARWLRRIIRHTQKKGDIT